MLKNNKISFAGIFLISLLLLVAIMTGCSENKSPVQVVDTPQKPVVNQDTTKDVVVAPQEPAAPPSIVAPTSPNTTPTDTAVTPANVKVFYLEADYLGAYPDRVYVNKSDNVRFIIHVRDKAYSGLRFVGKAFNETKTIDAGQNVTIDVVADVYFSRKLLR
jgi:hypothetical protein